MFGRCGAQYISLPTTQPAWRSTPTLCVGPVANARFIGSGFAHDLMRGLALAGRCGCMGALDPHVLPCMLDSCLSDISQSIIVSGSCVPQRQSSQLIKGRQDAAWQSNSHISLTLHPLNGPCPKEANTMSFRGHGRLYHCSRSAQQGWRTDRAASFD